MSNFPEPHWTILSHSKEVDNKSTWRKRFRRATEEGGWPSVVSTIDQTQHPLQSPPGVPVCTEEVGKLSGIFQDFLARVLDITWILLIGTTSARFDLYSEVDATLLLLLFLQERAPPGQN